MSSTPRSGREIPRKHISCIVRGFLIGTRRHPCSKRAPLQQWRASIWFYAKPRELDSAGTEPLSKQRLLYRSAVDDRARNSERRGSHQNTCSWPPAAFCFRRKSHPRQPTTFRLRKLGSQHHGHFISGRISLRNQKHGVRFDGGWRREVGQSLRDTVSLSMMSAATAV